MKMKIYQFLGFGLLLGAAGCGSNPFPETTYTDIDPAKKPQVFPALGLTFPSVMEFTEGQEGIYEFRTTVPKGRPVLEVQGLPAGVNLDTETNTISWTPSFTDGNDPKNAEASSRIYPLKVVMYGSEDPTAVVSRDTAIIVRDVLRPLLVWTTESNELTEGGAFSQYFLLASEDSPEEGIQVYSNDLPRGAVIEKDATDPLKYWIRYVPGFHDVSRTDSKDAKGYYRDLTFNLHALAPGRRAGQKVVRWRIRDVRKEVQPVGPSELVSSGDLVFSVGGYDQNREAPPKIELMGHPGVGQVAVEQTVNPAEPNLGLITVRWSDIPRSAYGKQHEFRFSACSYSMAGTQTNCVERAVIVRLAESGHKPPVIERAEWALGDVKEVMKEATITVNLPVRDGDTGEMLQAVAIEQSSSRCEASWSEGMLSVKALDVGYCQINLTATSAFGLSQKESLMLKVTPKPEAPTGQGSIPRHYE